MTWLFLFLSLALADPVVVVQTAERGQLRGTLTALRADQVVIATQDGPVELALDDVESIDPVQPSSDAIAKPDPAQWSELELSNGSVLLARDIVVRDRTLFCRFGAPQSGAEKPSGSETFEIPLGEVRRIRLAPRAAREDESWRMLSELDLNLDALIVRKGESLDYVEGVIGDVTAEVVRFTTDGEKIDVKRSKLAGMVFQRGPAGPAADPIAEVHLRDGVRLRAAAIDGDSQQLLVQTSAKFTAKIPWQQIERVEFTGGKSVYLSDLTPEEQSWQGYFGGAGQPLLAEYYRPRRNTTFSGGRLTLDGREFAKGLALHSRTSVVYDLGRRFSHLRAVAGIDPAAGGQGNVQLTLSGDGRTLWEDAVVAGQPAKPVEVDLAGVKRLTVMVDYGSNLDLGDHLILGQARLTP